MQGRRSECRNLILNTNTVYLEHLPSFKAELVIRCGVEIIFGNGLHGILWQVETWLLEVVGESVWLKNTTR